MNLIQAHIIFNKLLLDELLLIIKNTINFNLLINTLSLTLIILFKRFFKYKIKVETKAHLCFFKKGRGALWVCIWNQRGGGPKKFGNHWCMSILCFDYTCRYYRYYDIRMLAAPSCRFIPLQVYCY
jgi:hypothetical protein